MPDPDAPPPPLARIPFTPRAEASIRALANWMQVAAAFGFVGAVVKLATAFAPRQDCGKLIDAVLTFLIAVWVYQAGAAFRKVAATDTADQRHLMDGFRLLRQVFLLQAILIIVVFALLLLALVILTLVLAGKAVTGR